MNISEYRREYAAYHSMLEREQYNVHCGFKSEHGLRAVRDRYADLHGREVIDDIERLWRETPAHFETERAALKTLTDAARLGFVETRARELTDELSTCEQYVRVEWEATRIRAREALEVLARETDALRRRELAARWHDALRSCDDLRAARLESLRDYSRELSFDGYRRLHEDISGADAEKLAAAAAGSFLTRTAPLYMSHLAQWAAGQLPPLSPAELEYADSLYFRSAPRIDTLFAGSNPRAVYAASMSGLGIRVEAQGNILIEGEATPAECDGAHCFAVNLPDELRLVLGAARKGAEAYQNFFHQAGRAQHFAWASRDLIARYPEFIYPADAATIEGEAYLFRDLFLDAAWLGEHLGLRPAAARQAVRHLALVTMHDVRRCCARLRYALTLDESPDVRAEQLGEAYVSLHEEATGFRHSPAMRFFEAGDGLRAATTLRARLFAAALGEHLRARHGRRWWANRSAGDELIDMWNTASRYRVEELARLVGAGDLDFDLLADSLMTAMNYE